MHRIQKIRESARCAVRCSSLIREVIGMMPTCTITARCAGEIVASELRAAISGGSNAAGCRVAGRGHPRPAPSEPCMGLSIHTAQASAKASFDTRFHNCISGRLMISTAIEMVHLKVACGIRPALGSLHNMTNIPGGALCDGFLAGRTHAILPSPNTVKLRTAF